MIAIEDEPASADTFVERVRNQGFDSNTYICESSEPGKCYLIDPGLDPSTIDAILIRRGLIPLAVFCTHGHFDHLGSVDYFQKKYGAHAYMHAGDAKLSQSANFLMMACKVPGPRIAIPKFDVLVSEEGAIQIGADTFHYHHTPGHTPGSCFVEYRGHVFTGDTLYRNAIGLVKLPGENIEDLKASIRRMWDRLDDTLVVHPGHGGSATFGTIKANNQPLREFLGLSGGTA